MLRPLKLLCAGLLAIFALSASAIDLQQAKSSGQVGEQRDGYLGVVTANASAEVKKLVKSVNAARRQKYQGIAAKNKLNIKQVETLAAEKAINKTRSGHFIKTGDGRWVKK